MRFPCYCYDCYLENSALKKEYVYIRYSNKAKQTILAETLAKQVGFIGKCTLNDIKKVEDHLQDYQILVISNANDFEFVYVDSPKVKKIVVLYSNFQFDNNRKTSTFWIRWKDLFFMVIMEAKYPFLGSIPKTSTGGFAFNTSYHLIVRLIT